MSRIAPAISKSSPPRVPHWCHPASPLALGLLGSFLLWLALPPVDAWPLAWLAPVPWILLIRRKQLADNNSTRLPDKPGGVSKPEDKGRSKNNWPAEQETISKPGIFRRGWRFFRRGFDWNRPYVALWWAGFFFWLAAIHWLRYPHPLTHFGWLALSAYLAFYLPAFFAISRVAVHFLRVPLILTAPAVWTGLEFARGRLFTGFLMGALGHTQFHWIEVIQISDLGGAYLVSFLVMFVAACVARMLPCGDERIALWPILPGSLALLGSLIYGYQRTSQPPQHAGPAVALIQGAIAPDWKHDPDRRAKVITHYLDLTAKAVEKSNRPLDLIVWPETMYRQAIAEVAPDYTGPAEQRRKYERYALGVRNHLTTIAITLNTPLLFGIDAVTVTDRGEEGHNSALFISCQGELLGRYDKIHRVMFGEYVPLADDVPLLYELTPLTGGIVPGKAPVTVELEGVRYCPNICFETVVPHVIRRQVLAARAEGKEPDILVNLTNDAWFRGSSELDMHLVCGVFRAVECRKPLLIAANEGISASIDADGRVVHQLPKREAGYLLLTDIALDARHSWYLRWGDWPAGICLAFTLIGAVAGLFQKYWTSSSQKN